MRVIEISPSQSPQKDKLYTYADFMSSEFNKDSENARHVARISPRGGGRAAPRKGPFPSVQRAPSRALKGPHSRALKGPHSRALNGPSITDEKVGYKGGECSKVGICHGPYQLWSGSYKLLEAEVNNLRGLPYQLWNQQYQLESAIPTSDTKLHPYPVKKTHAHTHCRFNFWAKRMYI